MRWADLYKQLRIFADVTSTQDSIKSLNLGSSGVGILRIEDLLQVGPKHETMLDYLIGKEQTFFFC